MFRFIVACVVVAVVCVAGIALLGKALWATDQTGPSAAGKAGLQVPPADEDRDKDGKPGPPPTARPDVPTVTTVDGRPVSIVEISTAIGAQPMTILDARVLPAKRQDVPAERDGKLLFLATEVEPGEYVPADKLLEFDVNILGVRISREQWLALPEKERLTDRRYPDTYFRPSTPDDELAPNTTVMVRHRVKYRTLDVGDRVEAGQMVGLINPILALDDVSIKQQKVDAAESDAKATTAMKVESKRRLDALINLRIKAGPNAVSKDEFGIAEVTLEKYAQEEVAKRALVKQSQRELSGSVTILRQHIVRAAIPGVIRHLYRQPGEAVKNLDNVLSIQNPSILRAEAQVEVQDGLVLRRRLTAAEKLRAEARMLHRAAIQAGNPAEPEEAKRKREEADRLTRVEVEATRQEPPLASMADHAQEVTCVAVTREKEPRIVSGSEDHTVRIWKRVPGEDRWTEQVQLDHRAIVRSLAVTGAAAERNLLLTGTATGRGRLFDLDDLKAGEVNLQSRHTGAINAAAISEDGTMCVTGGEDAALCLWRTSDGLLYGRVPAAHRAAITSVAFTKKGYVVTAGRDKALTVWELGEGGENGKTLKRARVLDRRSGDVAVLGVDPTGEHFLFDDGQGLRVQSLQTRRIVGTLRNPPGTPGFAHFAHFSPDGKAILTGGNGPGRLQMWRAPSETARPAELRQFLWSGTITCAAFDPQGKFAVTGTQDNRVLVWKMPDRLEVEKPLAGQLTFVEEFQDTSLRRLTIRANVENPGWVLPGGTATIVVPPQAAVR